MPETRVKHIRMNTRKQSSIFSGADAQFDNIFTWMLNKMRKKERKKKRKRRRKKKIRKNRRAHTHQFNNNWHMKYLQESSVCNGYGQTFRAPIDVHLFMNWATEAECGVCERVCKCVCAKWILILWNLLKKNDNFFRLTLSSMRQQFTHSNASS